MSSNDNSVNIKNEKSRYHHGDLCAALVEEGLRLLAQSDVEHLSLRQIARNVGVSATAVYRHFPDKHSLLRALCSVGDKMLFEAALAAQNAAGGGAAGYAATGRSYVRFALANPALFRLMMSTYSVMNGEDLANTRSEGLRLLLDNVANYLPGDASADDKRVLTLQSWAVAHGTAMMMLDGMIPAGDALIDKIINVPGEV